jgi:hypothetical protein
VVAELLRGSSDYDLWHKRSLSPTWYHYGKHARGAVKHASIVNNAVDADGRLDQEQLWEAELGALRAVLAAASSLPDEELEQTTVDIFDALRSSAALTGRLLVLLGELEAAAMCSHAQTSWRAPAVTTDLLEDLISSVRPEELVDIDEHLLVHLAQTLAQLAAAARAAKVIQQDGMKQRGRRDKRAVAAARLRAISLATRVRATGQAGWRLAEATAAAGLPLAAEPHAALLRLGVDTADSDNGLLLRRLLAARSQWPPVGGAPGLLRGCDDVGASARWPAAALRPDAAALVLRGLLRGGPETCGRPVEAFRYALELLPTAPLARHRGLDAPSRAIVSETAARAAGGGGGGRRRGLRPARLRRLEGDRHPPGARVV